MKKTILDVGNCRADHGSIASLVQSNFDVQMLRAVDAGEAMDAIHSNRIDLVLVNRVIDRDGSAGIDLIRRMKADDSLAGIPVMLVSNYPEYQDAAIAAGAERGFGKASLREPETVRILGRILDRPEDTAPPSKSPPAKM